MNHDFIRLMIELSSQKEERKESERRRKEKIGKKVTNDKEKKRAEERRRRRGRENQRSFHGLEEFLLLLFCEFFLLFEFLFLFLFLLLFLLQVLRICFCLSLFHLQSDLLFALSSLESSQEKEGRGKTYSDIRTTRRDNPNV